MCPRAGEVGSAGTGRESPERARGAPSARPRPTPPGSAPPVGPRCSTESKRLSQPQPHPGRKRAPSLLCPHRARRCSGVAAPTSSRLQPTTAHAWAARLAESGPRTPGRRLGTHRVPPAARVCSWDLTSKGGGVRAGLGNSPKYTVLSHLGHLEAMVSAPGRLALSARARLRVAEAAPAPPTRLSERPLVPRLGRGVEVPPSRSRRQRRGSRRGGVAPAWPAAGRPDLPGAPQPRAPSGVCRRLACFLGNVGAAGRGGADRGARGPRGSGQSWSAGPRPGRAAPGHADGRPDGGPARYAGPRR